MAEAEADVVRELLLELSGVLIGMATSRPVYWPEYTRLCGSDANLTQICNLDMSAELLATAPDPGNLWHDQVVRALLVEPSNP